ncbi:MAG: TonB-dependent receptor [Sphingobacterium sp.]
MKDRILYRLLFFCWLVIAMCPKAMGQNSPAELRISIDTHNKQILQILAEIHKTYDISMSYDEQVFNKKIIYSRSFDKSSLEEVLNYLLKDSNVGFTMINRALIFYEEDKTFTVKGRVVDSLSGENLIGATLLIAEKGKSSLSNKYGFYSLTLPRGEYSCYVSYLGYKTRLVSLNAELENNYLVIKLAPVDFNLSEVVVNVDSSFTAQHMGSFTDKVNWTQARRNAFYKGEADIMKVLQMQNGINGLTEGGSNLFVRGSGKDQNLILLDEAVVYNPSHLFGLTSVFNSDILKNTQLYKDAIPANLGGRLSSIMDMSTRDGDANAFHVFGGSSLLIARVGAEGPFIKKGKGAFIATARGSILNAFNTDYRLFNVKGKYSDYNVKFNYTFDEKNRVYLSGYYGQDKVISPNRNTNRWGNWTSTLRWNHVHSDRLFMNLSAIFSDYHNKLDVSKPESSDNQIWLTRIRDFSLKSDFTYFMGLDRTLDFGLQGTLHRFNPGEISPINSNTEDNIFRAQAYDYTGYVSFNWKIDSAFRIVAGIRANAFFNASFGRYYLLDGSSYKPLSNDADKKKSYYGLEPRLSLQYKMGNDYAFRLAYNRSYQYLQLLQNDELAFSSLEAWVPAGLNIKPQYVDAISFRINRLLYHGNIGLEGYWKKMGNQVELIDHAQLILNPFIETQLRQGKGHAYGLELSVNQRFGEFTGSIFYSWSRSFRKINGINKGKEYAANFDIPHVLKSNLSYDLGRSVHLNAFYTIHTGRPLTYPIGFMEYEGIYVPVYSSRNSHRMPTFSRFDLNCSVDLETIKQRERGRRHTLNFGLYNVFDQRNPLYYSFSEDSNGNLAIQKTSFSGRVPSISYTMRF